MKTDIFTMLIYLGVRTAIHQVFILMEFIFSIKYFFGIKF